MSSGRPEDRRLTVQVLDGTLEPIDPGTDETWLRHATVPGGRNVKGQAGQIDLALLEGASIEEIAARAGCTERRVRDHFKHLEEFWNKDMEPHHLRLRQDPSGRWSFDEEWIRGHGGD